MQKKQILLNGKILTYYENLEWKKDWVLVFLHWWMQDGKSFEGIFTILEENNIPYISLDLPGFGSSALCHDAMTIPEYWEVVMKCIHKLWITNPVLVGHSFGGKTSIHLASIHKNIQKIILICSAGIQRHMPIHKYFIVKTGKVILSLPGLRTLWNKVRQGFSSPDFKNAGKMTKIFRNAIAEDYSDKMKIIDCDTLLIWWSTDDQTPVSDADIIHSHIKKSKLEILEWTHFVHQERVTQVAKLILNFIKK